ncbi:MAG: hypothetical protein V3T14_04015 [Myxococcota bacterium]
MAGAGRRASGAGSRPPGGARSAEPNRRQPVVEGLVQEVVRRAATVGLGGFFLTEEAIRKAFADVVPQDWVQFFVGQSREMRTEVIDRLTREFGTWLRGVDPEALAQVLLDRFDLSVKIEVTARRRSPEEPPPEDEPEEEGQSPK